MLEGISSKISKNSTLATELIETFSNLGFNLKSRNETTRNTTLAKTTIDVRLPDFKCKSSVIEIAITVVVS